jgi:hypothetical protein
MDTGGVGVASADLPAALAVAADQGAATVAGVELSAPLVAPLQVAGVAVSGAELTAEGGEQITIAGGAVTAAGRGPRDQRLLLEPDLDILSLPGPPFLPTGLLCVPMVIWPVGRFLLVCILASYHRSCRMRVSTTPTEQKRLRLPFERIRQQPQRAGRIR